MQITKDNIEELILLYIDNELDASSSEKLMQYINQNTEYKKLLADYQSTISTADTSIVLEDKQSLFKNDEKKSQKVIPFFNRKMVAVAAAILLLSIWAVSYFNNNPYPEEQKMAKTVISTDTAEKNIVGNNAADTTSFTESSALKPSKSTHQKQTTQENVIVKQKQKTIQPLSEKDSHFVVQKEEAEVETENILVANEMPIADSQEIEPRIVTPTEVPQNTLLPATQEKKKEASGVVIMLAKATQHIFKNEDKELQFQVALDFKQKKQYTVTLKY